jgi:hypothetical protein
LLASSERARLLLLQKVQGQEIEGVQREEEEGREMKLVKMKEHPGRFILRCIGLLGKRYYVQYARGEEYSERLNDAYGFPTYEAAVAERARNWSNYEIFRVKPPAEKRDPIFVEHDMGAHAVCRCAECVANRAGAVPR